MTRLNETYMNIAHGYAWRDKVMAEWRSLPAWGRAYWTLRGKNPRKVIA